MAACWERVLPTPLLWDSLSPSVPIKGLNLLCVEWGVACSVLGLP